jgi:hypothetical protein
MQADTHFNIIPTLLLRKEAIRINGVDSSLDKVCSVVILYFVSL